MEGDHLAGTAEGSADQLQMLSGSAMTYLPPRERAQQQAFLGKPFKQLHREQALIEREKQLKQRTEEQTKASQALEREKSALEREQKALQREQRAEAMAEARRATGASNVAFMRNDIQQPHAAAAWTTGGSEVPQCSEGQQAEEIVGSKDWGEGQSGGYGQTGDTANAALLRLLQQQAARLIHLENEAAERRSYDQLARWQTLEATMQHQTDRMGSLVQPVWRDAPTSSTRNGSSSHHPFRRAPSHHDDIRNVRKAERRMQPTVIGGGGGRQRWIPPSEYKLTTSPCHAPCAPPHAHYGRTKAQVNRAPPTQDEISHQLSQGARHGPPSGPKHAELYFGPSDKRMDNVGGVGGVGVAACADCHLGGKADEVAGGAAAMSQAEDEGYLRYAADVARESAAVMGAMGVEEVAEQPKGKDGEGDANGEEGFAGGENSGGADDFRGAEGDEICQMRAELAAALAREEEAKDVAEMVLTLAAAKEAESRQALASMALSQGMAQGLGPHGLMMPTSGHYDSLMTRGDMAGSVGVAHRRHRPAPQRRAFPPPHREPSCFTASPACTEQSIFRSNLGSVGSTGFDTELLPGESAWAAVGEVDEALAASLTTNHSHSHRMPPQRPRSAHGGGLRRSQSSHGLLVQDAARDYNQSAPTHSFSHAGIGQSACGGSYFSGATRSSASSTGSGKSGRGVARKADSASLQLEAFNKQRQRLGLNPINPPVWSTPEQIRKVVAKSLKAHAYGTPVGGGSPNKSLYHAPRSVKCSYSSGRSVPSWNWSTKVAGGPEPPRGLGMDPMMDDAHRS